MKGDIESITRVLDLNQIKLFKSKHCEYCRHYGEIIPQCQISDEFGESNVIIDCIENDKFCVKISLVRDT